MFIKLDKDAINSLERDISTREERLHNQLSPTLPRDEVSRIVRKDSYIMKWEREKDERWKAIERKIEVRTHYDGDLKILRQEKGEAK